MDDPWEQITDSVWSHAIDAGPRGRLRSHAIDIADGRLLVVSPQPMMQEEAHAALERLGEVALCLAPNHFHYLGLKQFSARHPTVACISTPTAAPRIERKCGVACHPLPEEVGGDVALVEPPGLRNGEAWVVASGANGPTWIVADAFFNYARIPGGPIHLVYRLLGLRRELCISRTWGWAHVADPDRYATWLVERLQQTPPTTLAVCHGDPITGTDLAARMEALLK